MLTPQVQVGGIISAANISELFRAPGLIQLWNKQRENHQMGRWDLIILTLYYQVTIQNRIQDQMQYIVGLFNSGRRYRVTYEVHYVKLERRGRGNFFIRIEMGMRNKYISQYSILHSSIIIRLFTGQFYVNDIYMINRHWA